MNSHSRFSHQLRFHLTKPDCPPLPVSPWWFWSQCVTLDSCVESGRWAEHTVWFAPLLSQAEGAPGHVWLQTCLWTRESLCPVSSERGRGSYTSICTRPRACLCTILSLLLFRPSFWRSILTPMLPPPSSMYKHSCSWAGSYIRDLMQAKSNPPLAGEKWFFNSDPIHHASVQSPVPGQRRGCCVKLVGTLKATAGQACTGFK